ncbi:hypothetical protein [Allorhizocola rhizosphaerae]|uniref:hypothetical protein n=1 Tax=Allorhizocola rhizosphaerae TaxID=1872709 RepID=UPI000E3EA943|nr:hypothetical protein [Allorhizocola rhizosphaerae]
MNGWPHPEWCAQDHQCTVTGTNPAGQHRSPPMRWNTAYGSLVAVRVQDLNGRHWMELRAHVRLGESDLATQEQASQLAVQVDLAVRRIALRPKPSRQAITGKAKPR